MKVGLTGGLASGKSTVAHLLAERGCRVVDADRLVAELYQPGKAGAAAVRDLFGPAYLTEAGGVDHAALAGRVFRDADDRRRLEAAIHPLVRERFRRLAADADAGGEIAVLEATLLVEAGYAPDFDVVVTVEAPPAVRLDRAVTRGLPRDEAERRLAAQGDGAGRRAAADVVIPNTGTLGDLEARVDELVEAWRGGADSTGSAAGGDLANSPAQD